MKPVPEMTVSEFIKELGSKTPSPGGGAVAALSGAMGAAQLLMVAEFATWEEGKDPKAGLRAFSQGLLDYARMDAEAYAAYSEARSKRKEDPDGYAKALERITEVPVGVMESCVGALVLAAEILPRAPKWFACDVSIAVNSLMTGAQGGRALAGSNLGMLKGPIVDAFATRLKNAETILETDTAQFRPLLLARLPGR